MTTCEVMQAAVVDELLPRPEGLEAHVASCEVCGAVARAHRAALRLKGSSLPAVPRRSMREAQRRAGIVFGLCLVLGGSVAWWQLASAPHPDPLPAVAGRGEVPLELRGQEIVNEEPAAEAELLALAALNATVLADVAREPREDATLTRVFGSLPRWTAPTRTQPLRSLGKAASPVVFTSEDSP